MELKKLDLSALPSKYSNNWYIYLTIRDCYRTDYAKSKADEASKDIHSNKWIEAFDKASEEWLQINHSEEHWKNGNWPDGASIYRKRSNGRAEAFKIISQTN